jgi:opacity protein-like surface antigen
MKKLAIIGMVFAGLMLSSASAWAQPTGPTKAEYRALMIRSEGLNQRYGLGQYSQQAIVRNKLGEIGAWAVPSTQQKNTTPLVSEKLAGLDLQPATTSASGGGFDWNDAGIGAALAFGFVVLGVGSLLTVRSQQHKPIPH